MAEWQHKERNWSAMDQENQDGISIRVIDFDRQGYKKGYNSDFKDFEDWLDFQCEDGWELFDISTDHSSGNRSCIFRRLV